MDRSRVMAVAIASALLAALSVGCASNNKKLQAPWHVPHSRMSTYAETPEEHSFRVYRVLKADRHGLAEDIDLFLQTDRPTRLNRWHDR